VSAPAVIADTTPVYALVDRDDEYSQLAHEQMVALDRSMISVVITTPILTEAYSLILRKIGIHAAHEWVDETTASSFTLNPEPDDYRNAVATVRRFPDQPITLTDAVLAATRRRLRLPVWTYDHHFDIMQVDVWRDA